MQTRPEPSKPATHPILQIPPCSPAASNVLCWRTVCTRYHQTVLSSSSPVHRARTSEPRSRLSGWPFKEIDEFRHECHQALGAGDRDCDSAHRRRLRECISARGHCGREVAAVAGHGIDPKAYSTGLGRRTVNSLPCPGPALATVTQPPWRSTRLRTKASPIPRPASARCDDGSAWTKRSNTCGRTSGSMPMPESRMRTMASTSFRSTNSPILPPSSVYFAAFKSRFTNTCSSRAGSACSHTGASGNDVVIL